MSDLAALYVHPIGFTGDGYKRYVSYGDAIRTGGHASYEPGCVSFIPAYIYPPSAPWRVGFNDWVWSRLNGGGKDVVRG
jgi:hypothetical protein